MHTCKECGMRINRHGSGHKLDCQTGQKTQKALAELVKALQKELDKEDK